MKKVIDVHVHLGASSSLTVAGGADTILQLMDENGIDQSIIFPMCGFLDPDGAKSTPAMNDRIAEAVKQYPDRFPRGLGEVEPRHGVAALEEVDRVLGELKLSGLMFHNDFCGVPIEEPIMFKIVEHASKYPNVVIMLHSAQHSPLEAPYMISRMAKAFPNVKFVNAHPLMSVPQCGACIDQALECPNIYYDTCITSSHHFLIERFVKEVGADRLMLGTDNPYFQQLRYCFDKELIEIADISEEDKDRIFYKTAEFLFGL